MRDGEGEVFGGEGAKHPNGHLFVGRLHNHDVPRLDAKGRNVAVSAVDGLHLHLLTSSDSRTVGTPKVGV